MRTARTHSPCTLLQRLKPLPDPVSDLPSQEAVEKYLKERVDLPSKKYGYNITGHTPLCPILSDTRTDRTNNNHLVQL